MNMQMIGMTIAGALIGAALLIVLCNLFYALISHPFGLNQTTGKWCDAHGEVVAVILSALLTSIILLHLGRLLG